MSESSDERLLESAYRTVTPSYQGRENTGMSLIGWVVFLGAMTLLFPLIPVFLLFFGLGKLVAAIRNQR